MKSLKFVYSSIVILICLSNQLIFSQTFTLSSTTTCGASDFFIRLNNPALNRANYVYINGILQKTASMPSVVRSSTLFVSGIVIPSNLFKLGLNTVSVTSSNTKEAYKIPNNVVSIDGFLDESFWNLNNMTFGTMISDNPIPNGGNSSVNFGILWDDNNLYIGVKVIDTTMFGPGDKDKLEIYIDPYEIDASYGNPSNYKEEAAMQLIIDYDALDESNLRFFNSSGNRTTAGITLRTRTITGFGYKLPSLGTPSSNRLPVLHKGTGFILEMSIPWSRFYNDITTLTGIAGTSFGFDIAYNDNQKRIPQGRNEQLFWNSDNLGINSNNRWTNTENFGSLTLSSNSVPTEILLNVFTVLGISLPATTASISSLGDCSSMLTVSGIVASVAGAKSYWQTAANLKQTTSPLSTSKILSSPIPKNVFINTLFSDGCWSDAAQVAIVPTSFFAITTTSVSVNYPTCGIAIAQTSILGIANNQYFWQTNATVTSTSLSATESYTTTGSALQNVYLRAQNTITGCWSDSLKTDATPNTTPADIPEPVFVQSVLGVCTGLTANVSYTNSAAGSNIWYWQTEPLGTSTGVSGSSIVMTTSGNAYIRAIRNGCWSRSTGYSVSFSDVVVPTPLLKNYVYNQNDISTPLEILSPNAAYSVNWYIDSPTSTKLSATPSPITSEPGLRNYYASYSQGVCEGSKANATVEVKEVFVTIAKLYGITPNGDNANEKFIIDNLNSFSGNKVTILDKWGNVVFEKENYQNEFDGKKNGKDLPFGSYIYIVDLNDGKKPLSGSIVLSR